MYKIYIVHNNATVSCYTVDKIEQDPKYIILTLDKKEIFININNTLLFEVTKE